MKSDSPPVGGEGDKKTAVVSNSDQKGDCNEELEELVRKEVDVSYPLLWHEKMSIIFLL